MISLFLRKTDTIGNGKAFLETDTAGRFSAKRFQKGPEHGLDFFEFIEFLVVFRF